MLKLRDYQIEANDAVFDYLEKNETGNPLVVLPTGSGKSLCIAGLVSEVYQIDPKAKILILQHRKELISQNFQKLQALCSDNVPLGIYSAGLGKKQLHKRCLVAGIQSIFNVSYKLEAVDLIIIDECHLMPPDGDGRYLTLIKDLQRRNPNMRVIGYTATPFRMKSGSLVGDDGIFTDVAYSADIKRLIEDGYLCPVVTKVGLRTPDLSELHTKGGEFVQAEAEELYTEQVSKSVISEFITYGKDRKSCLVFCSGVKHAEFFTKLLRQYGFTAEFICGDTPSLFRDQYIKQFQQGKIHFLVNVDVLTTGFDAPNVDCLLILRPTKSPGLYVQIIGRGMRIHANKADTLVLDFGGNIERHGPIDLIVVRKKAKRNKDGDIEIVSEVTTGQGKEKVCPKCRTTIGIGRKSCPYCGYEFPLEINHESSSSDGSVISQQYEVFDVSRTEYSIHQKGEDEPKILKIEYFYSFDKSIKDFLCFDHKGFARQKAEERWRLIAKCPEVIPDCTEDAVFFASTGDIKEVVAIKCKRDGAFLKPIAWRFKDSVKAPIIEAPMEEML